jgi:hypothetical protein
MAALIALRPEVMPHAPGCPLAMIDDAILKAVIEFCNRSRAYRFMPADIDAVADTADYAVSDLPEGTVIAWLLSATLDDDPLDLPDAGSVPLEYATETGTPTMAIIASETEIGLRKVPDADATLKVRLALRPSLDAGTYPDEFHNLYQTKIAAGALAKLWAQPGKPWSQPGLVEDARSQFESGIYEAEYRADRGSSASSARTVLNLIGGR